jgi:hypothetical protein
VYVCVLVSCSDKAVKNFPWTFHVPCNICKYPAYHPKSKIDNIFLYNAYIDSEKVIVWRSCDVNGRDKQGEQTLGGWVMDRFLYYWRNVDFAGCR